MDKIILTLTLLLSLNSYTQNQQNEKSNDSITALDEVIIKSNTILGNKFVAKNRTGAAYYLSIDDLAKFNYTLARGKYSITIESPQALLVSLSRVSRICFSPVFWIPSRSLPAVQALR